MEKHKNHVCLTSTKYVGYINHVYLTNLNYVGLASTCIGLNHVA